MLTRSHNALIRVFSGLTVLACTAISFTAVAAVPTSIVGVLQERTAGSAPATDNARSVIFYDANDIGGGPLFSVFMPYENGTGNLYEDPSSVSVNPATGDIYLLAFDSSTNDQWSVDDHNGSATTADDDTNGDWDVYRINFATVFNHWKTNYMGQDVRTIVGAQAVGGAVPTPKANMDANELKDYVTYGVTSQFAADAMTNANHQSADGVFDNVAGANPKSA